MLSVISIDIEPEVFLHSKDGREEEMGYNSLLWNNPLTMLGNINLTHVKMCSIYLCHIILII